MRALLRAAFTPAAVAVALLLLLPALASAQSIGITAPRVETSASPDEVLRHSLDPSNDVSTDPAPGDDAALAAALNYDPLTLADKPLKNPLRSVNAAPGDSATWSRKDQPDGSASLSVKQPLAIEWDSKVGADLNLPAAPETTYEPGKPLPGMMKQQRSGAAWANVTVPDLVTIEVRVAPSDEQRKVGTSVQRSMPIGRSVSVTLQNDLSVTGNYPTAMPAGTPAQIWDSDRKVKVNIASTGTTLAAASSNSSVDNLPHHTLSAEQKIYGPLRVTTSVSDPGQPTVSKSITAGFKVNW